MIKVNNVRTQRDGIIVPSKIRMPCKDFILPSLKTLLREATRVVIMEGSMYV